MKYFILFIIINLFYGCDLFSTRDTELPVQPRQNYQTAVTPEILIDNFVNSLKDKNLENYLATFSDPIFTNKKFVFSPSSQAASQFPALADNWGVSNEQQYFNNVIARISSGKQISLILSDVSTNPLGDSLIYTATYNLNVPFNDPSLDNNYKGELRLDLIRDSRSIWSIYFWQDTKSTNLPSWSELKGRFY